MSYSKILLIGFFVFSLKSLYCFESDDDNFSIALVSDSRGDMFDVGEELEYDVYYTFLNIGKIKFKVYGNEQRGKRKVYKAYAFMDSNPSLSWLVDLHVKFFSEIDENAFSYGWISEDSTNEKVYIRIMKFDYEKNKMYFSWGEKLKSGEYLIEKTDTITINRHAQDGLSLFYYARKNALRKMRVKVPTFIDTSEFNTDINFNIARLEDKIDAIDYSVDVVKLNGYADFVGIFGLTGYFEGVFSNDIASIPISAKLKVVLGSIRVELKSWKRSNWVPPRASSK